MLRWIGLIFLLLAPQVQGGSVIDGPANVRDMPNGKILVSLNDGVYVICKESIKDWFRIELPVIIQAHYVHNGKIDKGVSLRDRGGRELGVTMDHVLLELASEYRDGVSGKIIAYTHAQNIKKVKGKTGCLTNKSQFRFINSTKARLEEGNYILEKYFNSQNKTFEIGDDFYSPPLLPEITVEYLASGYRIEGGDFHSFFASFEYDPDKPLSENNLCFFHKCLEEIKINDPRRVELVLDGERLRFRSTKGYKSMDRASSPDVAD